MRILRSKSLHKSVLILIIATLFIVAMWSMCCFNGFAYADTSNENETMTVKQLVYKNTHTINYNDEGYRLFSSAKNLPSNGEYDSFELVYEFNLGESKTFYGGVGQFLCVIENRNTTTDSVDNSFKFGIMEPGNYCYGVSFPGLGDNVSLTPSECGIKGDYIAMTFNNDRFFISIYDSYAGVETDKYSASLNNILWSFDNDTEVYNLMAMVLDSSNPMLWILGIRPDTGLGHGYDFSFENSSCIEHIKAYKNMQVPVKEGHTFVGWYYDQEFTRPYNGEAIGADVNLYAKYEINKYIITFDGSELDDVNDPDNVGMHSKVYEVNYGTVLDYVPDPVLGKMFLGWYHEDGSKYEGTPVKSNMTLIGRWCQSKCIITFDFGDREGTLEPMEVEYGSKVELPKPISEDFKVWYWEDLANLAWNEAEPVTSDLALVATWEKYLFKVTFYVDTEVWKEVKVEKGKTLGSVALSESIDSHSVVGYENLNSETVATTFAEFAIEDDVAVYLSEVSNVDTPADGSTSLNAWQVFWNNVKAFFDKIGQWFKNLFSKFKK